MWFRNNGIQRPVQDNVVSASRGRLHSRTSLRQHRNSIDIVNMISAGQRRRRRISAAIVRVLTLSAPDTTATATDTTATAADTHDCTGTTATRSVGC